MSWQAIDGGKRGRVSLLSLTFFTILYSSTLNRTTDSWAVGLLYGRWLKCLFINIPVYYSAVITNHATSVLQHGWVSIVLLYILMLCFNTLAYKSVCIYVWVSRFAFVRQLCIVKRLWALYLYIYWKKRLSGKLSKISFELGSSGYEKNYTDRISLFVGKLIPQPTMKHKYTSAFKRSFVRTGSSH